VMMAKIKAGLLSLRDLFATAWWIVPHRRHRFRRRLPVRRAGAAQAHRHHHRRRERRLLHLRQALRRHPGAPRHHARGAHLGRFAGKPAAPGAGEADVGFVQGGVIEPPADPDAAPDSPLQSLGSLFYEPVWVFYRGEKPLTRLTELRASASPSARRARASASWPSACWKPTRWSGMASCCR
jgi:hypothetical protein